MGTCISTSINKEVPSLQEGPQTLSQPFLGFLCNYPRSPSQAQLNILGEEPHPPTHLPPTPSGSFQRNLYLQLYWKSSESQTQEKQKPQALSATSNRKPGLDGLQMTTFSLSRLN